jgi:hypothetical protein
MKYQLRHIYFRLISKEFFTIEKMFKYKMVNNTKCKRYGEVESYNHFLWECREVRKVWRAHNEYMCNIRQSMNMVLEYGDVFVIGDAGVLGKVKMIK